MEHGLQYTTPKFPGRLTVAGAFGCAMNLIWRGGLLEFADK